MAEANKSMKSNVSAARHAVVVVCGPDGDHAAFAQRGNAAAQPHELRRVLGTVARQVVVPRNRCSDSVLSALLWHGEEGRGRGRGGRGAGEELVRRGDGIFRECKGKHEAEGVLAVQVETVETLLGDEAEGGVQRERGGVVEFGLECYLGWEKGRIIS